jgi:hypothetical protein
MKKFYLLFSFLCLFLTACSTNPQLSTEENTLPTLLSGEEENNSVSPLYTITSVPSIEDTEALVDYYFNGDPSFWFESPEDMATERIITLVQHFLYQYGLPTTTLGDYYPLIWTGDVPWSEITNQSFFTNDPTRDIQSLSFKKVSKDIASYHCFFCEADRSPSNYAGEDKNNLFIDLA